MIIDSEKASELLIKGKIVAIPTETVYGLAASFSDLLAIDSIFVTKGRPSDNPLIVHISDISQLSFITDEINETQLKLMNAFWPGPLTLLFKKKAELLDRITAGLDTVAVRMPSHPIALEIIQKTGPIVAPSANKSGKPSTTRVEHILHDYGGLLPVVDGGSCEIGIESTVLDCIAEKATILRPGKITADDIQTVLPHLIIESSSNHDSIKPKSPGMKYTHYSPNATVRWMTPDELDGVYSDTVRYLHVHGKFNSKNHKGYHSNFTQFTKDLFDQFRFADMEHETEIAIEPFHCDENPIASALLNRIRKAMKAEVKLNHDEICS